MRSQQQTSHSQKITELRNATYNSIQYEKVGHLHRSGHDLHADIVVYRARRNYRIAARRVRKKVKKTCDKRYDLIHVQIKVRKLVPSRERKSGYVLIPSAQLCRDEFAVIYRSFLPKVLYNTL